MKINVRGKPNKVANVERKNLFLRATVTGAGGDEKPFVYGHKREWRAAGVLSSNWRAGDELALCLI